jgi:transcriptional repressor NrdR
MRCPACGHAESKVIDSRLTHAGAATRRRRECESCRGRFTTYERVEGTTPLVVKRDGRREEFDRRKIVASLQIACKKRGVATETIDEIASDVEQSVLATAGGEVDSADIGEAVMRRLRDLDEVAYVRFASVYREFHDANDFAVEAERVRRARKAPVSERQVGLFDDESEDEKKE